MKDFVKYKYKNVQMYELNLKKESKCYYWITLVNWFDKNCFVDIDC